MFVIADEVRKALAHEHPVVALESTVIAHGLPFPTNLTIAREMETYVRAAGAVPATIALFDGAIHVGLSDAQFERLATPGVEKVNLSNLSLVLARKGVGATTVAATIWCAAKVGIDVMATGGIGGVHHGEAWDVSNDLPALAQTPVAVVCSGAKSILDLRRTREWLETWGVPVVGIETDVFPAFFSRVTELPVDMRVEMPEEAAHIVDVHLTVRESGILVTVPVPAEHEVPVAAFNRFLAAANAELAAQNIRGADVTPALLDALARISEGATLHANEALLRNNATMAARLAVALSQLDEELSAQ